MQTQELKEIIQELPDNLIVADIIFYPHNRELIVSVQNADGWVKKIPFVVPVKINLTRIPDDEDL